MISGLAFILMPHFQALIIVGHFAKFRALIWMPYVFLTFLYLIKERSVLSGLLFSLAFAIQFRTQHYQIIFYTLMMLLFMGIPPLYRLIKDKKWREISKVLSYTSLAVIFSLLIVAQIFFSIKEYTPYSTRGGYAISIKENAQTEQDKKGVGFDYATNWSYSISEFWNLIVPKFHGGTSNEIYTGNAVPAFKNRELPTYWGTMPFTQSYEYIGILLVYLAFIGMVFQWSRWEVKSLTFLTAFALIMSLGKNFAILYKLFFYYVPYFDKFRAPVMILTLGMFTCTLLAAYGISYLMQMDLSRREIKQRFYIISGTFVLLLTAPLLFGSTFSFTQNGETQRYGQEVVNMLKTVRLEMLRSSSLQSLIFLLMGLGSLLAFQKKWIPKAAIPVIFFIIIGLDFLLLDHHYLKNKFINPNLIEDRQFTENDIDTILKEDQSQYRVFPVGRLFSDVHWVYHHQSIGGYSPAKLQLIQEIIENCLYVKLDDRLPINWNILKILNVKYVISGQELISQNFEPIANIQNPPRFCYQLKNTLPRAFFVKGYQVIADGQQRLKFLNNPGFDPRKNAILEKQILKKIEAPDSTDIKIIKYEPEEIELECYTDKTALMVLSEIYYPAGWHALLNETEEIEIYKTNHLIRSVVVPKGKHRLNFQFHPKSYYAGLRISLTSVIISHLLLLATILLRFKSSIKNRFQKKS
jgi:hypothetical protein